MMIDFLKNYDDNSSFKAIEGPKSLTITNGKASFMSLKLFSKPNSEIFFEITASKITRFFNVLKVKYLSNK